MRTAYAGGVVLGLTICHGNRRAAGMTLVIIARAQVMPHGDPIVEDEAVTAPPGLLLGHLLQILEDPALEMEHLFEAGTEHITGGLLAANASGAEHRHLLVPARVEVRLDVLGRL